MCFLPCVFSRGKTGPYLEFEYDVPFFVNALFWVPCDNFGLKRPTNSGERVVFVVWVQGKPKRHRALKVAQGP